MSGPPEAPARCLPAVDEARRTFVNGDFVATILLAAAFVEHRLGSHLRSKGYVTVARQGLAQIVACARAHDVAAAYLLDKVDRLRRIRNPFVHLKPFEHEHGLIQRLIRDEVEEPARLLEKASVDTSNPAIDRQGKTGQRSGALEPGCL